MSFARRDRRGDVMAWKVVGKGSRWKGSVSRTRLTQAADHQQELRVRDVVRRDELRARRSRLHGRRPRGGVAEPEYVHEFMLHDSGDMHLGRSTKPDASLEDVSTSVPRNERDSGARNPP